ncbi:hypothetical protein PGT21_018132 [Puccinia graminis f. sp. tritici]|uniref:Uncharacterized protein n=1 Tax=Puccinia graminis f. sp. tritici TaxID=56615 RepID=A0A5B0NUD5_PUCGR|nr:hypothetical protein PGT21_018132 [Puccinia graminis f. sp. tritici]
MDHSLYGAHSRIQLFLADLHCVLGSLPPPTLHGPMQAIFNSIGSQHNLNRLNVSNQRISWKRPTHRSRSWRKNRTGTDCQRSPQVHHPLPIPPVKQNTGDTPKEYEIRFPQHQQLAHIHNHHKRSRPQKSSPVLDQAQDEDLDSVSVKSRDESVDLDEVEWDDRSVLDINADPDHLEQQPEPAFDLKSYSADDVDRWASTLSAEEFEHLRVMGTDARTESFRQYAITNLDQPTQTLTPQLNQEPPDHIPGEVADNHDQDANNPCVHSHHVNHQPNQYSCSSYYEHSNYSTSNLDQNPDNTAGFDGRFDDGRFENGEFDDGGFYNGGFDDRFDDGGFDDGGFDDSGFDDGGFDDGGFDDGGFDDSGFDGGSNYY